MYVRAAGVILYRFKDGEPRFLLLENALHGTWGFPKGHLDGDEAPLSGARRECREETGVEVKEVLPGFEKRIAYSYVPSGSEDLVRKETVYLLATVETETVELSGEHVRFVWEPRLDGRARLQFDPLRELLDCAYTAAMAELGLPHPDVSRARTLLKRLSEPEEMWRRHSFKVAETSRRLAEGLLARRPDLVIDPSSVEASALLHDIGRARDQGIDHPRAGMELLLQEGLGHLAKPCLSHWLKGRTRSELEGHAFFTPVLLDALFGRFDLDTITLSEKIVALSDSLVMHDRLVFLDERYREARKRYGDSEWMRDNERICRGFIQEMEDILGGGLYAFLGL